ncbi:hypothetical protein N7457_002311 [Penicillium paradoxum]|uniref:uncharacterized protein n=1 Tax=Penicillium paradoxum TaxID=176176 RepID=UPI002547DC26|nr:uncharacterized protein N7457_002311 [Penicillium paradoxum]KAJ5787321.1 hypothetical protein N7457_002311 [Penicillium paradoxum]
MSRPLELRTRKPSPERPKEPTAMSSTNSMGYPPIARPAPAKQPTAALSATNSYDHMNPVIASAAFNNPSEGRSEPPSHGQKRAASMSPVPAVSAKHVKKEIPSEEVPRPIFPRPILEITGNGPVFDSNWYRSVLEDPALAEYCARNIDSISAAYDSLLINKARIEYDLRRVTEIMFQHGIDLEDEGGDNEDYEYEEFDGFEEEVDNYEEDEL